MADNRLLPFDAARFQAAAPAYPAWMSDAASRGIGTSFTPDFNQKYNDEIRGVDPRYAQYASQPSFVRQADASPPTLADPNAPYGVGATFPADRQQGGSAGGESGGGSAGPGGGGSGSGAGYGDNQGQYGGSLSGNSSGSASNSGSLGLGDPFGGRAPTSTDLGPYGKAAFSGLMSAAGPLGMIGTGLNTAAQTYNTAMNTQALGQMGYNPSVGQMIGGALGLNGYGGSLANSMNAAMNNPDGRAAIGTAQNPGPSPDDIAAANTANPTSVGAPLGQVDPASMVNPGDLSAPAKSQEPATASFDAPDTNPGDKGGVGGNPGDKGGMAGGNAGDAGGGSSDGSGGAGGPDGADGGGNGHGGDNAHGGLITKNKLVGPNPAGPDTGYASIQDGEGVMTRKAMAHYGPDFLSKVNRLLVPKNDNDDRKKRRG